jgi:hypothetical protein
MPTVFSSRAAAAAPASCVLEQRLLGSSLLDHFLKYMDFVTYAHGTCAGAGTTGNEGV